MIRLSVPTNWSEDLLYFLDKIGIQCVDEFYGALAEDFLGSGRPSFMFPKITKVHFSRHIKELHKRGIKFNYLLNATCIGNSELTIQGQRKLKGLLDWLVENHVDTVTVSIPFMLEFIKYNYPILEVYVSAMAGIDSLERAKYWDSFGADRITLSAVSSVTRNFTLLRKIKAHIKCDLQLIANLTCLYECPFWFYHSVIYSHASQSHHRSRGFLIDYCFLRCNYVKIKEPVEFIRAGWIRPEDLHYYEDIGITGIKLANRPMSTESIARLITAYKDRRYEGDLLWLFSDISKQEYAKKLSRDFMAKLKYFLRPLSVNIFKLLELKDLLGDSGVSIDNRALDGFLEHFMKEDCSLKSCQSCNYCEEIAKKALRLDDVKRLKLVTKYNRHLEDLNRGKIFTYFNE